MSDIVKNIRCAYCKADMCTEDIEKTPEFCPRRIAGDALKDTGKIYAEPEIKKISDVAAAVEDEGYKKWQRVKELVEFSKRMDYKRLGIAFCIGLIEETRGLCRILESHGFIVDSVCCTVEGGCNPVGQAKVLNHVNTDLNIIMGLCIGHDILFSKYSEAPVTTLVVKDRVTCHNPAAPLTNRYWRDTYIKQQE